MEVRVIGGTHDDSIDLFVELVEHFAKVNKLFRFGMLVVGLARAAVIDVAQCDDVLAGNAA